MLKSLFVSCYLVMVLAVAPVQAQDKMQCTQANMDKMQTDMKAMGESEKKMAMQEMKMAEDMMKQKDMEGCMMHMQKAMDSMKK